MSEFLWLSLTSGKSLDLTNWVDDVAFTRGASGLIGAPPIRKSYRYIPGLPGAVVDQMIHDINTVQLPLVGIVDGGWEKMMALVRKMVLIMDPVRNPEAILRFIDNEGVQSDLYCATVAGLEVSGTGDDGPNGQKFAIGLEAVDPYWYGPTIEKKFTAGEGGSNPWFGEGRFPPIILKSGSVLGNITLDITSDVETWPVFTAGGPSTGGLHLENETSEKILELDDTAELIEGDEPVIVDTRPRGLTAKTVLGPGADDDEKNWFKKSITGKRSLWALQPGPNKLNLIMPGAVTGTSFIKVEWRNARLTPGGGA